MKKVLFILCSLFAGLVLVTSCSSEDHFQPSDSNVSELEAKYFTIEDATYAAGEMPTSTAGDIIQGLSYNTQALTGGMNFVTIVSRDVYKQFFVGVQGVSGYWIVIATLVSSENGYYTYYIPIMYSTSYNTNIIMIICGEKEDGNVTEKTEAEVTHVDSEISDLNLNLTFSNAKDVDLHLYTPSGKHIYYGARGGSYTTSDGETITYGLDHDSNAGCFIDNLNNENIYIPAELIEAGTYRVVVDMYSNCDTSIPTSWSVVARYRGGVVPVLSGRNPASGVYPVGAGDDDMTEVMTFSLTEAATRAAKAPFVMPETFKPTPMTEQDWLKLDELNYRRQ